MRLTRTSANQLSSRAKRQDKWDVTASHTLSTKNEVHISDRVTILG